MIIDTHCHTVDDGYPVESKMIVDADMMVDAMDRFGISEMWISPATAFVRDFWVHNKRQNELFKKVYPSRFRCYAVFNPYFPEETREDLKRCFEEYGCEAIKLHSWMTGFVPHQPAVYEIIEASIKYRVPVMMHDGSPPFADTLQIAALAERYPEARIILGHTGLFDSWRAAVTAVNTHPNLWTQLSASALGDAREILKSVPKERVLFGSDFCFGGSGWLGETLIGDRIECVRRAVPDRETYEWVLWKSAQALLKLS